MTLMLKAVDLFAGAGGLSLGVQRAGLEVVAAFDNWKPAADTYRLNFDEPIQQIGITRDLAVPSCDVIVGGPPCQGFSSAGLRRTHDERNTLVGEYSHLIARVRPAAFIFENVEGFLTGHDGLFVFELLEPLIEAGYRIHLRKINAANYGVPQHRKRVVAIGGLGWEPVFPRPTHAAHGAPGAHLANGSRMMPTPALGEVLSKLPPAVSGSDGDLPDHAYFPLDGDDLRRAELLKPGQTMRDLPEELWHESYRRRAYRRVMDGTPTEKRGGAPSGVRRLKADEPSKAITGGALRDFLHPSKHRPLTIRECAVIQTFPEHFHFAGSKSDRIQLIGNAVPPLLAQRLVESVASGLKANETSKGDGCLLSFVPTLSEGMSPALHRVSERVKLRFGSVGATQFVGTLWH